MSIVNAIITQADIEYHYDDVLVCNITVEYGDGSRQGVGSWPIGGNPFSDNPQSRHSCQSNKAADFIGGMMVVAGVTAFSKVSGSVVRVEISGDSIRSLGHIIKEVWYCPADRLELISEKGNKENE